MEKLVVMGGVGEDEMKGKHVLLTTIIYIYIFYSYPIFIFMFFLYFYHFIHLVHFFGQVTM